MEEGSCSFARLWWQSASYLGVFYFERAVQDKPLLASRNQAQRDVRGRVFAVPQITRNAQKKPRLSLRGWLSRFESS